MKTIQAPSLCPSCDSKLEWVNHLLYCRNASCICQVEKIIEHFAKTLQIKGLGPSTVVKLQLNSVDELYNISEEYIADCISSDRLAEKLIAEIEGSKMATLNQLLPAFSIRLIGKSASEKLSFVCENITDIDEDKCKEAGLGPKATANMLDWMVNVYPSIAGMPFSFKFKKSNKKSNIAGVVCISGKLVSFKTKALATEALLQKGYAVKANLTKEVTILLNESGVESAKTKKARDSGITVVNNITDIIGEII
jgi:NAD-dependent DNA ligase